MHPLPQSTPALPGPGLDRIAVLIPAWRPEPTLPELVQQLIAAGVGTVLVVDDGSGEAFASTFEAAAANGVVLLRHARNLGKGRALKTGFAALLREFPLVEGVVTADADGQHTVEDILRIAGTLAASLRSSRRAFVLGVRSFDVRVPLRSRLGNTLTRIVLRLLTGRSLRDTQTGLRGFPRELLPELLGLKGERYEFEMSVLLHVLRGRDTAVQQVPIATVYIDGNRSSHFDPLLDSMRIYFVLARFYASALLAAAIEFTGFALAFVATHQILLAIAAGRISSLVNFAVNRRFVFRSRTSWSATLLAYGALAVAIALASYVLISWLHARANMNVFAAKLLADSLLSLVSFAVQRALIFRHADAQA